MIKSCGFDIWMERSIRGAGNRDPQQEQSYKDGGVSKDGIADMVAKWWLVQGNWQRHWVNYWKKKRIKLKVYFIPYVKIELWKYQGVK